MSGSQGEHTCVLEPQYMVRGLGMPFTASVIIDWLCVLCHCTIPNSVAFDSELHPSPYHRSLPSLYYQVASQLGIITLGSTLSLLSPSIWCCARCFPGYGCSIGLGYVKDFIYFVIGMMWQKEKQSMSKSN
jgi:hypothetical protein